MRFPLLMGCSWPGNVRQLENAIEHAVAISGEHDNLVRLEHLPAAISGIGSEGEILMEMPKGSLDFESKLAEVESRYLVEALNLSGGVWRRAADLLHVSSRSFRHHAKK